MENPTIPGIELGSKMTIAMISPVLGGLVRTWTATESRLWSVADPVGLSGLLGRGLAGRTAVPDNRFREAVFLNEASGALVVQNRYISGSSRDSVQLGANVFQLGDPVRGESNPWTDLQQFLSEAAVSARERDEFWVAELGGWDAPTEPFCFFGIVNRGGVATSVIEAVPVPRGTDIWPDAPADQSGSSVSASATADALPAVGLFATSAVHSWGVSPWDIALTFGSLRGSELPNRH